MPVPADNRGGRWSMPFRAANGLRKRKTEQFPDTGRTPFTLCHADQGGKQRNGSSNYCLESAKPLAARRERKHQSAVTAILPRGTGLSGYSQAQPWIRVYPEYHCDLPGPLSGRSSVPLSCYTFLQCQILLTGNFPAGFSRPRSGTHWPLWKPSLPRPGPNGWPAG